MAKKLLDNKFLYVILSVILAFCLWFYVTAVDGVTDRKTVYNIPVTFIGEDILRDNGLMITSEIPNINMRFEAIRTTLNKLGPEAIELFIDVSSITQPGSYTMAYDISYNGVSRSNFTVTDQSPMNVSFTVEQYVSSQIEIRGQFTGQLADGYMIRLENNQPRFEFTPQKLTVSGKKSDVDKIAYALLTVKDEELSKTVRGEFPYELIGLNGEPLERESLNIECSVDTIYTVLPVQMFANIPLKVDFVLGGGVASAENFSWDVYPDSITVAGQAEDLESLLTRGALSVATINLEEIADNTTTLVRTIPLADELTNVDGVTEAVITITIHELNTKNLEATDFIIQNVPEGYNATVQTKSLNVIVRGKEEELELISAANLRVVADLTDINLASGQYTVNARIYFDGTGSAGVVGVDYPLVVRLTKR